MALFGIFITGLLLPWDSSTIFKPLAESLHLCGFQLSKWDDPIITVPATAQLLIVGHSLGGERAVFLARDYGCRILCLLDPVHKSWALAPVAKPTGVELAVCFNRDKPGYELPPCFGLTDPKLNNYLDIPHGAFPTDPTVHLWLSEACKRMEAA